MKLKAVLTLSILILFGIGALSQKQSPNLKSSQIPPSFRGIEKENSNNPFKIIRDDKNLSISAEALYSLSAAVVNQTYIEKLDSLVEYSWNMDSLKWGIQGIEYYLFDALGRNYSYWDTWYNPQLGSLVPDQKIEIGWNSNFQFTSLTDYYWNEVLVNWKPGNRTIFSYNNNRMMDARTFMDWNVTLGGWEFRMLDSTLYNAKGMIEKVVSYSFNDLSKLWDPTYQNEYIYNPDYLLEETRSYYWIGDTSGYWEPSSKMIYHFNELGRDTINYTLYWYGEGWDTSYYEAKKYDAKGNIILIANYYWNGEMRWWEGNNKTEYIFDANDRLEETINYSWDWYMTKWYIYGKSKKTWDAKGNLNEEIDYGYDTTMQQYIPYWKETYAYDLEMDIREVAMPYYWSMDFMEDGPEINSYQNKVASVERYAWNTQLTGWDHQESDTVYYSKLFDTPVDEANCKADFDWTLGKDPLEVSFSDLSDRAVVARYWMFGDGKTSTSRNPRHKYSNPGTYKVMLTTIDELGFCSNTMVKQVKVGNPECNAQFSVLVDPIKQVVSLSNKSAGNNLKYFWSFGDGSMSKDINPVHTYEFPGAYPIMLTVTDALGTCMDMYTSNVKVGSNPCNAEFVGYIDSSSNTVMLRAKMNNPLNLYRWILGDGTVGRGSNMNHTFSNPGYYSASLTVSNLLSGCVETLSESILIGRQTSGGIAGFIYAGGEGNTIAFTNKSLGSDLSYYWDFNDTEYSKEKDPKHQFVLPGYYDVCLTVMTKEGKRNTYCEKVFAGEESKDQCLAKFEYYMSDEDPLKIYCSDRSFGEPDTWTWLFNNMDPSTMQNPEWHAGNPGFVKIRQTISNSKIGCIDNAFALLNVGAKSMLKAAFGYIINEDNNKAETYPVDFIGVSLGDAGKLKWSFGDGSPDDTTSINPVHYYQDPGTYEVCLTITNESTGEEDTSCEWITVGQTSRKKVMAENVGLKAWPNPFGESAEIEIHLNENSTIELTVYDLVGRKIRTIARENRMAGTHTFNLNGSDLAEGNYYLILETGSGRARQIISVIR